MGLMSAMSETALVTTEKQTNPSVVQSVPHLSIRCGAGSVGYWMDWPGGWHSPVILKSPLCINSSMFMPRQLHWFFELQHSVPLKQEHCRSNAPSWRDHVSPSTGLHCRWWARWQQCITLHSTSHYPVTGESANNTHYRASWYMSLIHYRTNHGVLGTPARFGNLWYAFSPEQDASSVI